MKNLIECPAERAIYFLGGKWKIRILFIPLNKKISEIKNLATKSNIFVIIYLLCEPSQNGALLVCLHAQKNIFFVSSALYANGVNSVPLCDPSQNGCFFDCPHEHQ